MKLADKIYASASGLLSRRSLSAWLLIASALAVIVRFLPGMQGVVSRDMTTYLLPWVDYIRLHGAAAYADAFSDYAPLYTYLLAPVAWLPQSWWICAIKLLSILADLVTALAAGAVVAHVNSNRPAPTLRNMRLLAVAMVLWLPTVMMNSAMWGQCDAMWAGCCILSLLGFLRRRPVAAMLWFGLAVSFKQQAVFFFPVVFAMVLADRARWGQLLLIPAVYAVSCLPAAIAGRSWLSLLGVYLEQGRSAVDWYANSPSPYIFLRDVPYSAPAAQAVMAAVAVFSIALCMIAARRLRSSDTAAATRLTLILTAFCGVFYPYVLPMMHERYMYLGDIATLVAALALARDGRLWWAAFFTQCASGIAAGSVLKEKFHIFGVLETSVVMATAACLLLCTALYGALKHGKTDR